MTQADIDKQEEEKELKERLKKEVLEQLKVESLKKEIVNEVQRKNARFSFAKFAQHPAFLAFMGFVLTGIIGNQLASRWQRREWDRQQARLVEIRSVEQKYRVIDEISKAIGEHNSAAQYVMVTVSRDLKNDARLNKELPELSKNWDMARRDWRTSASILKQKIVVYFKNQEARKAFERIIDTRLKINAALSSWLEELNSRQSNYQLNHRDNLTDKAEEHIRILSQSIDETSSEFEQMADLMVKEIQATVEGQ